MAILALAASCATPVSSPPTMHDVGDDALVVRPTRLASGIGLVHQPVSTASSNAQRFYDQGLAHLHSYRWIEAARSFHEALRADRSLAMAHGGLARASIGMRRWNDAARHLDRARAAARGVTPTERDHLDVLGVRLRAIMATNAGRRRLHRRYRAALDELVAADTRDVEAWLLRGQAEEAEPWGHGQGGGAEALPFYERALASNARHHGAHHYLAHTLENLGRYEEALEHAEAFVRLAPRVPHAHHMVGHVLPRLGRWEEAARRLEHAVRLERAYFAREDVPPAADWHHVHNLSLLGLVYLRLGREAEADVALREAFAVRIDEPGLEVWHALWPEALLVRHRCREADVAARALGGRGSAVATVVGTALAGEAALCAGRDADADVLARAARARVERLPAALADHPMVESIVAVTGEFVWVLDVRRGLRGGDAVSVEAAREGARQITGVRTFDAWGSGWLRLRRLAGDARALGRPTLAESIERRMR